MTEPDDTTEQQDADAALYATVYRERQPHPLTAEDEALYASIYTPKPLAPLTDEEQRIYNQHIPEN
jgi:hypothetical protein